MKRELPTEENYFQTLLFFGPFLKIPANVSGPKPNKTFSNENVKNTKKRKLMKTSTLTVRNNCFPGQFIIGT